MMDVRQLRSFVAVADELHFARAAARLNVSQQPLSVTVRRLEEELGFALFERTTRRVTLTPAGTAFLAEVRPALRQIADGIDAARRAERGLLGRLAVGYVSTTLFNLMPPTMRLFRERFPDIEVTLKELSSPELEEAIRVGSIHVALLHPQLTLDDVEYEVLVREHAMVVLPRGHRLAAGGDVPMAALAGEPFVGYSRDVKPIVADQLVALCRSVGFSPRIVQEADTDVAVIGLVSAGVGVSIVPSCLATLRTDEVVYRRVVDPDTVIEYGVALRRVAPPPAALLLRDIAREAATA